MSQYTYTLPIPRDLAGVPAGVVFRSDFNYVSITDPDFVAFNAASQTPDDLQIHLPAPLPAQVLADQAAVAAFKNNVAPNAIQQLQALQALIRLKG